MVFSIKQIVISRNKLSCTSFFERSHILSHFRFDPTIVCRFFWRPAFPICIYRVWAVSFLLLHFSNTLLIKYFVHFAVLHHTHYPVCYLCHHHGTFGHVIWLKYFHLGIRINFFQSYLTNIFFVEIKEHLLKLRI